MSKLCENRRARSLSDIARLAVQELIRRDDGPVDVAGRLQALDDSIGELSRRLERLAPPAGNDRPENGHKKEAE